MIILYRWFDGFLIRYFEKVGIPMDEKVPDWKDHKACWNFEYRGSLGESLLHVLIVCNSSVHSKIARMLILAFPNLALDVVEGNEFRGKILLKLFKIQNK